MIKIFKINLILQLKMDLKINLDFKFGVKFFKLKIKKYNLMLYFNNINAKFNIKNVYKIQKLNKMKFIML